MTEAEQNRLIQDHMDMVVPLISEFRGRKGIPFEDMISEGTAALVAAARVWRQWAKFSTYATHRIRGAVLNMIDRWEDLEHLGELSHEDEDRIHEWQVWGILPSEGWSRLPATPEEIAALYESIKDRTIAINAALLSLSARERKMIRDHFLREPAISVEQLARDHKLSYHRTDNILYGAVKKLREIVEKIEDRKVRAA